MDEPRWLTRKIVDAIHDDQLQQHGGLSGIRDEGAIESALARPKHFWTYAEADTDLDLERMAAAYGVGLARNHGYQDGNKRTAFMAMYVFLRLNGLQLNAEEPVVVEVMREVAQGNYSEEELTKWLRQYTEPK